MHSGSDDSEEKAWSCSKGTAILPPWPLN